MQDGSQGSAQGLEKDRADDKAGGRPDSDPAVPIQRPNLRSSLLGLRSRAELAPEEATAPEEPARKRACQERGELQPPSWVFARVTRAMAAAASLAQPAASTGPPQPAQGCPSPSRVTRAMAAAARPAQAAASTGAPQPAQVCLSPVQSMINPYHLRILLVHRFNLLLNSIWPR